MANTFKNARAFISFDTERFTKQHKFQLLKIEPGFAYVDGQKDEKPSFLKALVMIVADYTEDAGGGR